MAKIPKRIICLVTVAVILCAHVPHVHAEAVPSVLYGSSTVADIVMSYYAMGGAAVANSDWINTLYDSLGSNLGTIQSFAENGYLVTNPDGTWYATQALEQAIENAPAYQSLGLDQVFNVSAQEAAAGGGLAASTGAATLAGATGAVGSVGVIPLLGGVTAAYWGGIAIGTIAAHLLGLYDDNIYSCQPITFNAEQIKSIVGTQSFVRPRSRNNSNSWTLYYSSLGRLFFTGYLENSYTIRSYLFVINPNNPSTSFNFYSSFSSDNGVSYSQPSVSNVSFNSHGVYDTGVTGNYYAVDTVHPLILCDNSTAYNNLNRQIRNGDYTPAFNSPDLIGSDGNLNGEKDQDGKITVPDFLPQVDPSVQSGKPLTLEDWLRFANGAKSNNSDPDGKTKNKKLFDDILDEIRQGVPSTPDNPDPDPDPYHPPTPTPVPDPDYGDPNPDQPEFESETDVPDPVDTGNPWVTPDLLDKFPFCIPKDMIDMVKGFKSADRTAPHISWNFKSPVGHVDYTFNLDLEDFEDVATLLRALELAAFIVGLAFATRYLIGAS